MHQYCSVCKQHLDMEVVSESGDDGVIWLKCPQCKGILPHMGDPEDSSGDKEESASTAVDDLDISKARPYEPHESYVLGDIIYHRGWDDYGVVTAKEELPGHRLVIRVKFVEHGEMQLIEGKA